MQQHFRKSRRLLAWVLAAVAIGAVLAACNGGESTSGSAAAAASQTASGVQEETTGVVCDSGEVSDAEDPCVLTTVEQLQLIGEEPEGHYALGSAIDASATADWNDGAGFEPIQGFAGSLDGRGHAIEGLTINRPETFDIGFFAILQEGGEVRDLVLTSASVVGQSSVGILAGEAYGRISNVHVDGRVDGKGVVGGLVGRLRREGGSVAQSSARGEVVALEAHAGGLAGQNFGEISSSYSLAAVTGRTDVGGLVGRNGGVVSRSYSLPAAGEGEPGLRGTLDNIRVGSLIGDMTYDGSVQESYAISFARSTPRTDFVGFPLVASSDSPDPVKDSYYGGNQMQYSASVVGELRPVDEMNRAETFEGWDFETVWRIAEGEDYPDLVSNPRQVQGDGQ